MSISPDNAHEVATDLLDTTGEALQSGDFDLFRTCFLLPQIIGAVGGLRRIETEVELRLAFEQVRGHYRDSRMARLDREIEVALFDGPDLIRSSHVTRMLSADDRVLKDPVLTLSRLAKQGDRWQIAGTQYTVHADSDHGKALLGQEQNRLRDGHRTGATEAVVQGHLDQVSNSYLENNFDLLVDSVQFPLFVQASVATMVIANREELETDFKKMATQFRVHSVTDVVRLVQTAELISDKRILATCRTHILSKDRLVIPAYKSAMTIEQGHDLKWRMTSIMHPMGHLTMQAQYDARRGAGHRGIT